MYLLQDREKLIAYAAGFFDGEGSISTTIKKKIRTETGKMRVISQFRIAVSQTDPRPLSILKQLWSGRIRPIKRDDKLYYKPKFTWRISGNRVVLALTEMLPYLIVKREQAELALELRKLMGHVGIKISSEIFDRRLELSNEIVKLKHKRFENAS